MAYGESVGREKRWFTGVEEGEIIGGLWGECRERKEVAYGERGGRDNRWPMGRV